MFQVYNAIIAGHNFKNKSDKDNAVIKLKPITDPDKIVDIEKFDIEEFKRLNYYWIKIEGE